MRVTIADVARTAGVSKTTVSRVLNGKGEVDGVTAERVRRVIAGLGYVPSSRAVGLARGKTRTVGMLVPSLGWPWMGEVLQGVVDTVEAAGYGLLLFTANRGEESMRQFAAQVSSRSFDGLLAIEPENTLDSITAYHRAGLPVVLIDDRGHHPEFPSVATTNRAGGDAAARHLVATGRSRPLVVTGPPAFGCSRERLAGFRTTLEDAGLRLPASRVFVGDFTELAGRQAVQEQLAVGAAFDSVFAFNDLSAAGALRALREKGLTVPGDVAVVGFDDIPLAIHTEPPLTTVHQPMREMGESAAAMLLRHLGGERMPDEPVVLPTRLVTRGSAPDPQS